MNAEELRDAITKEMLHYSHSKLTATHVPYILHPVTNGNCSSKISVSSEQTCVPFQPPTTSTATSTFSQLESSATNITGNAVNDDGLADVRVKPEVPGISTASSKVDGNSVEMPSACQQSETDDVTMLSARSVTDTDRKLKDEICQLETCDRSCNGTNTSAVKDNCTDTAAAASCTQSDSNSLIVDTNPPLAADVKARIKAALLNSGRRRQRLGECYPGSSLFCRLYT